MRILVVTNFYPPLIRGGYEVSCAQMVDALRSAGHHVLVVTSQGRPEVPEDDAAGLWRILELPPIYEADVMAAMAPDERRRAHLLSNYVNPANVEKLIDAINKTDPEVAYLWNTLGLGGLGILALLGHYGIPWVWHMGDMIIAQMTRFGAGGDQLARELAPMFPGRFLFVSRRLLGEVRVEGVALGQRVEVVRNAVDPPPGPPRRKFYDGGTLRLVYAAGSLGNEKGTGIALEAVARAREGTGADIRLDIYGADPDGIYRDQTHSMGLGGAVRLLGLRPHPEVVASYRSYDVFMFPTWSREPFGLAALDAAACGCVPLITHDIGLAEWLVDGVDCLKAPRTPEAFAQRLSDIVRGAIDLPRLARRSQTVVTRDFRLADKLRHVEAALATEARERRPARGSAQDFLTLAQFAEQLADSLLDEAGVV
jgi:glycogen(starch) synthase